MPELLTIVRNYTVCKNFKMSNREIRDEKDVNGDQRVLLRFSVNTNKLKTNHNKALNDN